VGFFFRTRRENVDQNVDQNVDRRHARYLVIPTRERSEAGEPALSEVEGNPLFYRRMHRQGHDMPLAQIPEVCIRARLQARRKEQRNLSPFRGGRD
jgi:hypothetical protein